MLIKNNTYGSLKKSDLLICVLGYESRSRFLLKQNLATRNKDNTLVFCLEKQNQAHAILGKIEKKQIKIVESDYKDLNIVKTQSEEFIKKYFPTQEMNIHIDYSSMPRSWYCYFPLMLDDFAKNKKKMFFWYVSGSYPNSYKNYPSAGIDSISVFSGLSLPAVDIKRFHIIGLGYDYIRTETMISIIEPESLISCYAYNPLNNETKRNVYSANRKIIDRSLLSVALPLDNFSGIVDKLCELAFDLMQKGQVVFVPDGPKPLIMAMSLVPGILKKNGITCLHISRNTNYYSKINVKPRKEEIYGFQI